MTLFLLFLAYTGGSSGKPGDSAEADADADADTTSGDPCVETPPAHTRVVDRDETTAEDGVAALVCDHATFSASGTGARGYTLAGGGAFVSGAEGRGWGLPGASVAVTVAPGELVVESADDVVVVADGGTVTLGPSITLDPSRVSGGC